MLNFFKKKEEEVVLPVEITGSTTYCVFQQGRLVGGISYWGGSKQWEFNTLPHETLNQETIEAVFNKLAELNLNTTTTEICGVKIRNHEVTR